MSILIVTRLKLLRIAVLRKRKIILKTEPTEELEVKRVTKGDIIAKSGYFYTPAEHEKVEKQQKALRNIEALCTSKTETKRSVKPVEATA